MRILTIILLLASSLCYADLEGKVVAVSDGDTLTVLDKNKQQNKIRLKEANNESKNSSNNMEYHTFSYEYSEKIIDAAENVFKVNTNPLSGLKVFNGKFFSANKKIGDEKIFYLDIKNIGWSILGKNSFGQPILSILIPEDSSVHKKHYYKYYAKCNFGDKNNGDDYDYTFRLDKPEIKYTISSLQKSKKNGSLNSENISTEYHLPQFMIFLCLIATSQELNNDILKLKQQLNMMQLNEINKP